MYNKKLGQLNIHFQTWSRKFILFLMDAALIFVSAIVSIFLRFEGEWRKYIENQTEHLPVILAIYLLALAIGGMYRRLWRYAGVRDLVALCLMMGAGGVLTVLCNMLFTWGMSRGVLLQLCIISTALIGGTRLGWKALKSGLLTQRKHKRKGAENAPRLMIVGAGSAATYVLHMCDNDPRLGLPVLLVDDDPLKLGQRVGGVPVRGASADIQKLAKQYGIQEIIIAIPSLKGNKLNKLVLACKETGCRVRISMLIERAKQNRQEDAPQEKVFIRELNTADFLSRDEVHLDAERISGYLSGKRVLVTGGGGSIGSEICRQVMKYRPEQLIVFDVYENCAYDLECELKQRYGRELPIKVLIGSIRDKERLNQIMEEYRPEVVFHAAAHKHVPLMEMSPAEAVKNNVLGTRNVLEAASAHGVERLVQLSTDKAVNPTNVMGATKRITELMIQSFARKGNMKCMAVRFGNVLGSHGSVIPLFERQIKSGGPVTITHPDIIRFFMTIPEAAQLVLQAGSLAHNGAIYVLDMGEPVKIKELAEKLIRFYGYEPGKTMAITYTGLRPGEKMYEELLTGAEEGRLRKTDHNKIMIAPAIPLNDKEFEKQVKLLIKAAEGKGADILPLLREIVPEFKTPEENEESKEEPAEMKPAEAEAGVAQIAL